MSGRLVYAAIIRIDGACQEQSLRRYFFSVYFFSLRDRRWRRDLGANGKVQKEQEQSEAQPDGA
jgi:hypothetical protein